MSLRSLLGRRDKSVRNGVSDGPPLPIMPSKREIIADIEQIKKNDAILSLAAILEKNASASGRHSMIDTDVKELMEAMQKRKRRESASSTGSSSASPPLLSIPSLSSLTSSTAATSNIRIAANKSQPLKQKEAKGNDKGGELSSAAGQSESLSYDKLKDFLSTCEHSQELIDHLEIEFKALQNEVSQSLQQENCQNQIDLQSNNLL